MRLLSKYFYFFLLAIAFGFASCSHKMAINSFKKMETQASLAGVENPAASVSNNRTTPIDNKTAIAQVGEKKENTKELPNLIQDKKATVLAANPTKHERIGKSRFLKRMELVTPAISLSHQVKSANKVTKNSSIDGYLKLAIVFLVLALIFSFLSINGGGIVAGIFYVLFLVFLLLWALSL